MQEDDKSEGLLYILKFESIFFRVGYTYFRDQNFKVQQTQKALVMIWKKYQGTISTI